MQLTADAVETRRSWFNALYEPRPFLFAVLIITGIALEFVVHYQWKIEVVYTHFYYVIILFAGLWYGRRAVAVAFLFGGLHLAISYLILGAITLDPLLRMLVLIFVALIIGTVVEQMNSYHDRIRVQNRELTALNADMQETHDRLAASQQAYETANKKLNLLSSITRHDIRNQLTALHAYIELAKMSAKDKNLIEFCEKEEQVAATILRQIEFTRDYEEIGVKAPVWLNIASTIEAFRPTLAQKGIELSVALGNLEFFVDPLFEKVIGNLIDNSLRHGVRVYRISMATTMYGRDLALVYLDDGIGVHLQEKERIFERGFGKNTGLGLFLTREILSITGLSIKENGEYGNGARFEILAPEGKYRVARGTPGPA
jgi:signal transduction histidine kinase